MEEKKLIEYLQEHLNRMSDQIGLEGRAKEPVRAYLAGGFAVSSWTDYKASDDVDIKRSHRLAIPPNLQTFEVRDLVKKDDVLVVGMDGSFSDVLVSFPPDWEEKSH